MHYGPRPRVRHPALFWTAVAAGIGAPVGYTPIGPPGERKGLELHDATVTKISS